MEKKAMPIMIVMLLVVLGSLYFAWQGTSMHAQVESEEAQFHAAQEAYLTISKQERDSAASGSQLNAQLVEIANYPSELLKLKLVGIGKILTGIFLLLLGILLALMMMPVRLKAAIKNG